MQLTRGRGVSGSWCWLFKESPKFTLTCVLTGREHSRSPFFTHDKFTVQLPVCGHNWRNVAASDGKKEATGQSDRQSGRKVVEELKMIMARKPHFHWAEQLSSPRDVIYCIHWCPLSLVGKAFRETYPYCTTFWFAFVGGVSCTVIERHYDWLVDRKYALAL